MDKKSPPFRIVVKEFNFPLFSPLKSNTMRNVQNKIIEPLFFYILIIGLIWLFADFNSCNEVISKGNQKRTPYHFWHGLLPEKIADVACYDGVAGQTLSKLGEWENEWLRKKSNSSAISEEERFASMFHQAILKDFTIVENSQSSNLKTILKNLVEVLHQDLPQFPHPEYQIFLVTPKNQDYANAFTTGGGYIYFTTPLYNFTKTNDERAFIVAHELAHLLLGHTADRARRHQLAEKMLGHGAKNRAIAIWEKIISPLEQIDELACDLSAVYAIYQTGIYEPEAGLDFYYRLSLLQEEKSFLRIFSSHPVSDIRKACLGNYLHTAKMLAQYDQPFSKKVIPS